MRNVLQDIAFDVGRFAYNHGIDIVIDRGAHSYTTMTLLIRVRGAQDKRRFLSEAMLSGLEVALRRRVAYERSRDGTLLLIEKYKSECRSPDPDRMLVKAQDTQVPLAVTAMNDVLTVDMRHQGVMAVLGPPRLGKSNAVMAYMWAAMQSADAQLVVCAPPGKLDDVRADVDWRAFESKRGCLGIVDDYREMHKALMWVVSRMQARELDRPTYVVMDDMVAIKTATNDLLDGPLTDIATTGPGMNAHLIVLSQRPGSKEGLGTTAVHDAATCRVAFRFDNAAMMYKATGLRKADANLSALTQHKGDVIVVVDGRVARAACPHLKVNHMEDLDPGVAPYPWRDAMPVQTLEIADLDGALGTIRSRRNEPVSLREMARLYGHMFPVADTEDLNEEQCVAIRELHEDGMSLNRIYWVVFCLDEEKEPRRQYNTRRKNRIEDVLAGGTGVYYEGD